MSESAALCSALVGLAVAGGLVAIALDVRAAPSTWVARHGTRALGWLAVLPVAWLAAFGVQVSIAHAVLGRWPRLEPLGPEHSFGHAPPPLQSDALGACSWLTLALLFPAFLSLAAYLPLGWHAFRAGVIGTRGPHGRFAAAYLALCVIWWLDPGGVVRWWID